MTGPAGDPPVPTLSIPDIRDYDRINAELAQCLDAGHARVCLQGAEGQRLLAARLTGTWRAEVEIEGHAGPELAAELNAPALTVVCRGSVADGAGRALRAGTVVVLGDAGPAVGYAQEGGAIIVAGRAAARAGLNQRGGVLIVLGGVGPLAGERQAGGHVFAPDGQIGPHAEHGTRGGRFVRFAPGASDLGVLDPRDAGPLRTALAAAARWVAPGAAPA